MRMIRLPLLALAVALAAACQVPFPAVPAGEQPSDRPELGTRKEKEKEKSSAPAVTKTTPTGSASPGASPANVAAQQRLARLTEAILDAAATREIARAQGITNLISNNGGSLIADKSGGLVSKIRTGIISNNGASYRVAQASASQSASASSTLYSELFREDPPFQYITRFYSPNFNGAIVGFLLDDYKARGQEAEVVERLAWDSVQTTVLDRPSTGLFDARVLFPVKVIQSRRMGFTKRIDLHVDVAIKAFQPVILTAFQSMTVDFEMAVPRRTGGADTLILHAHDFEYPQGAGPGETPDGIYPTPEGFLAEGENANGKLQAKVINRAEGASTGTVESSYTRADGLVTKTVLKLFGDGHREERVNEGSGALEARLRYKPDGSGEGDIVVPGSDAVIGSLTWDATGQGEIALKGETPEPIRLY